MPNDIKKTQNLMLENCERLVMSGIKDVVSFDETALSLETELGRLEIRGNNMHIDSFDTSKGDMTVGGYIYACVYKEAPASGSFFKRIFK